MTLHTRTSFGSDFSIDDIKLASGPPKGVTFEGNTVKICESLCAANEENHFEPIHVTYSVAGGFGLEMARTAVFNLSKTEDGPPISSSLNHHPIVKNGAVYFDLSSDIGPQRRLF